MSKNITHDGVVIHTEGTRVTVRFIQSSACSGCHAKGICSSQDSTEKVVVADGEGVSYQEGEKVRILVSDRTAWLAVRFAFALPLVLALVSLFAFVPLMGEVNASLATLGVVALYYLGLYLCRNRLGRGTRFTLQKVQA